MIKWAWNILAPAFLWLALSGQSGPDPRTNGTVRFGDSLQFDRVEFKDSARHRTVYYVANREASGPILLLINGSGCGPNIASQNGQGISFLYGLLDAAQDRRFTTMIVEKPYSEAGRLNDPGTARPCSAAFRQYFTRDNWVRTISEALGEVRRKSRRKRAIFVIGLSEGASVAAGVARKVPAVSHVAMVAGSGTTQGFGVLLGAYAEGGTDQQIVERVSAADAELRAILLDPDNPDRWYRGHPHRRWSSFLRAFPDEDLLASRARVFILAGMQDRMSPMASSELLYAKLLGAGRDVTMRRLPGAGHSLLPEGSIDMPALSAEYKRLRDWAVTGSAAPAS
jgi:pimeloyl-ACP methyl ester carboxylesterase